MESLCWANCLYLWKKWVESGKPKKEEHPSDENLKCPLDIPADDDSSDGLSPKYKPDVLP